MSDVFISYARSTEAQAIRIAGALAAMGYGVWRDDDLPAHRAYAEVIEERLKSAKAVLVIWSAEAARSQWVRAEANLAREAGALVQLRLDGTVPPLPFNEIQCADLTGWEGDADAPGWRKVLASIAELAGPAPAPSPAPAAPRKLAVCVLPFVNMSGDPEQEYFSDGITEDIITDLSKVSALFVAARNSAFTFKGRTVQPREVAAALGVSHVLEGSVRKSGGRVRITAQLIDGATGGHVWAERYDRDLNDIFALQDEISAAIVGALKLKLLPEEKTAIARRGTDNAQAYNLFLMARQYAIAGNYGDSRQDQAIIRMCRRATEIDPGYADAWALIATTQMTALWRFGGEGDGGLAAADRALALNPELADAHAIKARISFEAGRLDEAAAELATALRLDPESWEVNQQAAMINFRQNRFAVAAAHFERSAALLETDVGSPGMLVTTYTGLGDRDGARRAARVALARVEKALVQDRGNVLVMSFGVSALAALGEAERVREWMDRALLLEPDNANMRYNFACALAAQLGDKEGALEMLGPAIATVARGAVEHTKMDPDMALLRDDSRYQAMIAAAEARLAAEEAAAGT